MLSRGWDPQQKGEVSLFKSADYSFILVGTNRT